MRGRSRASNPARRRSPRSRRGRARRATPSWAKRSCGRRPRVGRSSGPANDRGASLELAVASGRARRRSEIAAARDRSRLRLRTRPRSGPNPLSRRGWFALALPRPCVARGACLQRSLRRAAADPLDGDWYSTWDGEDGVVRKMLPHAGAAASRRSLSPRRIAVGPARHRRLRFAESTGATPGNGTIVRGRRSARAAAPTDRRSRALGTLVASRADRTSARLRDGGDDGRHGTVWRPRQYVASLRHAEAGASERRLRDAGGPKFALRGRSQWRDRGAAAVRSGALQGPQCERTMSDPPRITCDAMPPAYSSVDARCP